MFTLLFFFFFLQGMQFLELFPSVQKLVHKKHVPSLISVNVPVFSFWYNTTAAKCTPLLCLITEEYMSLNQIQVSIFYSIPEANHREYPVHSSNKSHNLIPGRQRWKVAVIPAVEMCQLLMGLSIETPFPQKTLARLTPLVRLVTLPTAGCLTLTYQSHYSSSANTPQHKWFLHRWPHWFWDTSLFTYV